MFGRLLYLAVGKRYMGYVRTTSLFDSGEEVHGICSGNFLFGSGVRNRFRYHVSLSDFQSPFFAHPDGSLRESKKESVLHLMKDSVNSSIPGNVNVVITDGMFIILTSVKDKTPTLAARNTELTYAVTCMNRLLLKMLNANQEDMRILKNILYLDPVNAFQVSCFVFCIQSMKLLCHIGQKGILLCYRQ